MHRKGLRVPRASRIRVWSLRKDGRGRLASCPEVLDLLSSSGFRGHPTPSTLSQKMLSHLALGQGRAVRSLDYLLQPQSWKGCRKSSISNPGHGPNPF